MAPSLLPIDRGLSNHLFNSWRLQSDAQFSQSTHALPGRVEIVPAGNGGFLRTKTLVQHNHLHHAADGGFHVFLCKAGAPAAALFRVEYRADADGVATQRLTGPLDGQEEAEAAGGLLGSRLPPSVASVAAAAAGAVTPRRLLVSSGCGDLRLLTEDAQAAGSNLSPPTCPLRAAPPLQGVRPFLLEAAYEYAGRLRCVVSALRGKAAGAPAACEVFALTFKQPSSPAEPLELLDVQLLQTSAARPQAAVVAPELDCVLLALEPDVLAAPGAGGQGQSCRAAMQAAAATAAEPAAEEVEEVDANPRSLQQAVDNLARFTSDQPAGGPPSSEQLADIDSEAGPGDEGSLGSEPETSLVLLALSTPPAGPSGSAASPSAAAPGAAAPAVAATPSAAAWATAPQEIERLAGGPHRLLGIARGSGAAPALLGVTDDVDCAVLRLGISGERRIVAEHAVSLPALAYVAAGKVQRRAVLLGQPGSNVAAAIVEAHAYAYVYKAVAPKQSSGCNLLVQLGLSAESLGVLGSSLVQTPIGGSSIMLLTEDAVITVTV